MNTYAPHTKGGRVLEVAYSALTPDQPEIRHQMDLAAARLALHYELPMREVIWSAAAGLQEPEAFVDPGVLHNWPEEES